MKRLENNSALARASRTLALASTRSTRKTNLTEEYDFELTWQFKAPKTLNDELKKYGLKLESSTEKLLVELLEIHLKK